MPGPIGALKWIAPSTVPIQDILTKQMSTCVLSISQQLGKLIFHVFVQLFLRENKTPFVTLSALHHGVCVAGVLHGWGEWHLLPLAGPVYLVFPEKNDEQYFKLLHGQFVS